MEMKEKKDIRKIIKTVCASLWYGAIVLLFILMVSIFISRMSGKVPRLFGYSIVKIVSPSMKDEIPVGTYILLKKVDAEDVKQNDVICFYSTDPAIYGRPNTHRVVEPPIITENGIEFVTKGDTNLKNDDYRAEGDRLVGKYVGKINSLTALSRFAEGKAIYGLVITIVFAGFAMVVYSATRFGHKEDCPASESEDEKTPKA